MLQEIEERMKFRIELTNYVNLLIKISRQDKLQEYKNNAPYL